MEKEAEAVTGLIKGVKIIVPFAVSIASIVGVYYTMEGNIDRLENDLMNEKNKTVKLETQIIDQGRIIQSHSITLSEVKTDLKHIKDDTKETLDLVRTYFSRN